MKKRILFVDDEPRLLQGLKRMLYSKREQWEMSFVLSGTEALTELENVTYDVIVSDMRMPGMDGGELLRRVAEKYPWMVRIVLSGQANKDLIFKSVGPTHQYLSKPCEAEKLIATITRGFMMSEFLSDINLRKLIAGIDNLPSLPNLYHEILNIIQSGNGSLKEVGDVISRDIGMSAKILQLVNSSFFGLANHIKSIHQAVSYLGLDTLRILILSINVFSQINERAMGKLSMRYLWDHSMRVGEYAKRIARYENERSGECDYAFLAGHLHDVGRLVLATNYTEKYSHVIEMSEGVQGNLVEAEREVFNVTHTEVGAYLMGIWGLPEPIVLAIARHHQIDDRSDTNKLSTYVYAANQYARSHELGCSTAPIPGNCSEELRQKITKWGTVLVPDKEQV